MLKEALYCLTNPVIGNIIYFNDGKILEVKRFYTNTRGFFSDHLNKEGQIILSMHIEKDRKDILKESKPIRYGDTFSYDLDELGYVLIDIFYPNEKRNSPSNSKR